MAEHYLGHRKRLKERFRDHPDSLHDYELLELLIGFSIKGRDVKPIAKRVLKELGDLGTILHEDIACIDGIGPETDLLFKVVKEYAKRTEVSSRYAERYVIESPESIFPFLKHLIGNKSQEHFVVIFLDGKNSIIDHQVLSVGTVNQAVVYPRESVKLALEKNAVSVLFAHNHPSGSTAPSDADVMLTKTLIDAFQLMDIGVLDHLIVSKSWFTSLKKEGVM